MPFGDDRGVGATSGLGSAGDIRADDRAPAWRGGPQDLFDRILRGMVGVGLVQEAICAFLLLTIETLSCHLIRLDLPTPSARPMRKPSGKRAWSVADVRVLISLWTGNMRAEAIGAELERSAGAVRAKGRRLGLYRRNRRDLVDATAEARAVHEAPMESAAVKVPTAPQAAPVDTRAAVIDVVPLAAPEAAIEAASVVVEPSGVVVPAAAAKTRKRRRSLRIVWTDELDMKVARRWYAWQWHRGIAEDLGLTEAQVRSRATRMGLPPRDRAKIVPDYVEGRPYDTSLEESRIKLWCHQGNMNYWTTRNGPRTSPKIMKTKRYKELRSGLGESYTYG